MDTLVADPNTLLQSARQAHDARDWPLAVALWRQVRAELPGNPLAFSDGAVALREAGDTDAAEALIAEALERFPDFLGAFIVWADLAMRRRDWVEADIRWAALRQRFPNDGQGYVHGAHALQQLGRLDAADRVLTDGRGHRPNDPWVMSTWGYFAQHHLGLEEALRRFAEIRLEIPRHSIGYVAAAILLRDRQRYTEAEIMLAGALARFPTDAGPLIDYASVAQARGDLDEANDRWTIVRERFPDHPAGYINAAGALRAAGRHAEADDLTAKALDRFADDANLFFEHGRAANARGDWAEAARRWATARSRFPGHLLPHVEEARALQALGRIEDAEAVMAETMARFPSELGAALAWADLAMRRRDWPTAATRWKEVRARFPQDASAVIEGSRALQDAGRVEDAEAMVAAAIGQFPDDAAIARISAEIAMRRQIWPEAVRRWALFRARFPDDVAGFVEGARALQLAGNQADAEALLAEAAERFPTIPSVRFGWAELASARNDWIEAHRRWDAARTQFPNESRAWVESANALTNAARTEEADALLGEGHARLPGNLDIMFNWALLAARHKSSELGLERWQQVRAAFPDHTLGYTFGAHALQDAGRDAEAEALVAEAVERFPRNMEVARAAGEVAARRGELAVAAERFGAASTQNPSDIALARRWVETLVALQRQDEARSVLDGALRIWPRDRNFLRRRVMLDIQTGRFEGAQEIWRWVVATPDLADELGYDLAWAIYTEDPPLDLAREVLLFLIREPDTGARDWLPKLAGMIQIRGLKQKLASQARQIIDAEPDAPCDRATMDVLRCALLFEYSDDDIIRFLRDYVAAGRVALTGHLFCQNYWKTKEHMFERFTAVFEQYMAEKSRDLSWVREDNATELLAYLNFAAVHSDAAYAALVREMRERLDLAAMHAQGLQTIPGAVANIALLTRIDTPSAPTIAAERRRLRVAICVSGQLRGFQQAVPTWRHLGLEGHDVSVYVHVWKAIGRNWQRIWFFARPNPVLYDTLVGPNGLAFLRDRYPRLAAAAEAAAAESNEADEPLLRDVYNTDFVRIEDDTRDRFRSRHNLWKMHYKVEQAHRLALGDGRAFDLMIRLRPDREFLPGAAPDWNAIHAQSRDRRMVFTDSPYLFTERQTWLGDQFAVGTQDVMDVYSSVFSDMEGFTRTGAFPPDVPDHIRPHTNLFYLCFYGGLIGRKMPDVTFGKLLDPAMLSVTDVMEFIRQDVSGRTLDDFDTQFIAACEAAVARRRR